MMMFSIAGDLRVHADAQIAHRRHPQALINGIRASAHKSLNHRSSVDFPAPFVGLPARLGRPSFNDSCFPQLLDDHHVAALPRSCHPGQSSSASAIWRQDGKLHPSRCGFGCRDHGVTGLSPRVIARCPNRPTGPADSGGSAPWRTAPAADRAAICWATARSGMPWNPSSQPNSFAWRCASASDLWRCGPRERLRLGDQVLLAVSGAIVGGCGGGGAVGVGGGGGLGGWGVLLRAPCAGGLGSPRKPVAACVRRVAPLVLSSINCLILVPCRITLAGLRCFPTSRSATGHRSHGISVPSAASAGDRRHR